MYRKRRRSLKTYRHLSVSQFFVWWWGRFYSVDAESLLALDISAQRIPKKKPTIPLFDLELGLLAFSKIGKREVVGHHYVSMLYAELTKTQQNTKMYGEEVMQVIAKIF